MNTSYSSNSLINLIFDYPICKNMFTCLNYYPAEKKKTSPNMEFFVISHTFLVFKNKSIKIIFY